MTTTVTVDGGPVRRQIEHLMGMPVSLALRGRHADTAAGRRAWRAVVDQLHRVDRMFSTYRVDSVISRLGRGELAETDCPAEVREVLELGRAASEQSGGAFSVWLPDDHGSTRLEPSGVVKGWAVQRASMHLTTLGDTDFCLSAGGDMVCHVADPGRSDWWIGVEHPLDPTRVVAVIPVRAGAVATSGTARRGRHLVDARTGRPVTGVASVTVTGPSLTWADIDATAAYAQGVHAADWLRTRLGRSALVVWPDATTTVIDGRLPADW